ncbi:TetR/AcrR family transcriptional regulator [Porphyromonas circumdentaria]|uniref:Transcriptional regulator, TetR family n=1 Tax=Porphyromonas circumdentaria TaxID=29524 RepID=A0A1T4M5U0_9PORP|nr:TetR/AcrR family transcriptional regulator [Porphyromonas circumdentaria]MBB6275566.1 AcrR family transcriptional regulator [Porphyromonas circumdentaria]SJZ62148.1 transcriptional regulator, TetR family [Porphyromonas circumdentaria]
MQATKDYTRQLLLDTAREAFFKKGYKAVSMREISQMSGVGLSNIYNYYENKDSLLAEVLRPLLDAMNAILYRHNTPEYVTIDVFTSEEIYGEWFKDTFAIVSHYREELKLLFSASHSPRFANFTDEWIDKSSAIGMEYIRLMKEHYPQLYTNISPFYIRFASSLWVSVMKEVVQHEELSLEDTERFIGEYIRFSTGGWEKLMYLHEKKEELPQEVVLTSECTNPCLV